MADTISIKEKGGSIMPLLVCSAQRCVYNDGMYCSKGEIQVGGEEACRPQETCCSSFQERTKENGRNSMGTPSQTIDVACEACQCRYNSDQKCQATKIGIAGAGACECQQTECSTFDKA